MGLEAETPVFARISAPSRKRYLDIDELWPSIRSGSWPPGFSMSRAQIYDSRDA